MKNRFDRIVPETPASFHDSLERALRATTERERRSVRLRPAALIAAALALVLAGAALALGDRMGLWSFLKQYADREIPAKQPPAVEVLDRSARLFQRLKRAGRYFPILHMDALLRRMSARRLIRRSAFRARYLRDGGDK